MAKFIGIMSGKGGVGKTTTSINLALAMAKKGSDVVLVDGNLSAPNVSVHLGESYFPVTIHDVMSSDHSIHNAVYKHHTGIKIIPADLSVEAMKLVDFEKFFKSLQDLHLSSDYVLVDGSPGLGRESEQLIKLVDDVLIVTQADKPSVLDAKRLKDFVIRLGKNVAGVLLTKHSKKSYRMSIEEVEDYIGVPVIGVFPEDHRFEKSIHNKLPYLHLYPSRKPSKVFYEVASALTGRVL